MLLTMIYEELGKQLNSRYNVNVGLCKEEDKIAVIIPSETIIERCSDVYDIIHEVSYALNISKAELNNYIDYYTDEQVQNINIRWYNKN